jgi:hypothetical protein
LSNPYLSLNRSGAVVIFQALVHHYCLGSRAGVFVVELLNNLNLVAWACHHHQVCWSNC